MLLAEFADIIFTVGKSELPVIILHLLLLLVSWLLQKETLWHNITGSNK